MEKSQEDLDEMVEYDMDEEVKLFTKLKFLNNMFFI